MGTSALTSGIGEFYQTEVENKMKTDFREESNERSEEKKKTKPHHLVGCFLLFGFGFFS